MKQLDSLRDDSAKEVWELFIAIYGLKQAPSAMNKHLADTLHAAGWTQSLSKPSLWTFHISEGTAVAALVCVVDDLLIASGDFALADLLIADISS